MIYIQAPEEVWFPSKKSIFLAGGISNCTNWQPNVAKWFINTDLVVVNPRREDFTNCSSTQQIIWEFERLKKSDIILFWFPPETVCPITLYELGAWAGRKPIIVGCHRDYSRKLDLEVQLGLKNTPVHVGMTNFKHAVFDYLDV